MMPLRLTLRSGEVLEFHSLRQLAYLMFCLFDLPDWTHLDIDQWAYPQGV